MRGLPRWGSMISISCADCCAPRRRMSTMKAYVLAEALGGRVIGASDIEVTRATHPMEASASGDLAVAISADTVPLLSESRAKVALVLEGTESAHLHLAAIIFIP